MSQQIIENINYILLAINWVSLICLFITLRKARKLLALEEDINNTKEIDNRKTIPVAIGYEGWYKNIGE